ncbi:MAG TPA: nitroreductase family deazaflavin-dependent oxidoreductase [Acidimicrobiia bacterium]|nr:nitroreductase family deazaflavin-dependent oxidoreductase [Acidimicrobiia bacterium]
MPVEPGGRSATEIPWFIRAINPLVQTLLEWGIPMGPNMLLTVRGRKSGQPRTAGVAVVEIEGRHWVIGSYGEVNWVRNLRAAGEGVMHRGRTSQRVVARELGKAEAAVFFRELLAPYVAALPWIGRRWVPAEILEDPDGTANAFPVFELRVQP